MKFPNWFKIAWWIILLALTGLILFKRYNALIEGNSVSSDILVFLVFVALMLAPIFSEINFFGIKLKREFEELKNDLNLKFGDIKNEIHNNQAQTFNATIHGFGPPPPDSKLPDLDTKIDKLVKTQLQEQVGELNNTESGRDVPIENLDLFKTRYTIEQQLKRIWFSRFGEHDSVGFQIRYQPLQSMIRDLQKFELLDTIFYDILKEILSICDYAIHGNDLTEKQISFVKKNADQVIKYLYKI